MFAQAANPAQPATTPAAPAQFFAPKSAQTSQQFFTANAPKPAEQSTNSFFQKPATQTNTTNAFAAPAAPSQTQNPKIAVKPAEEKELADVLANFQSMIKDDNPACIYRSFGRFPNDAVS